MPLTKPRAGQLNFDVTKITDPLIVLHSGHSGSASSDVGIVVERGSDTNVALIYDESADTFAVINTSEDGTTDGNVNISSYADIRADTFYGNEFISMTGDITLDANSSNHDIKFKGNDGGSVITALTLDMSSAGRADFNNGVTTPSYFWQKTDGAVTLYAGANFEIQLTHVHNTGFKLTETGGGQPTLQFVDANESISSDGTNLKLTSGGSVITVPASAGNLVVDSATQTLTNKTITNAASISVANTSTDDSLLITTTEDSSSAGPVITLKRNSASPADADYLGQLKFKGENDADQEVVYAKITGKILDASDGSEDGLIEFANVKAGSNVITARLRSDSLQLLNGTNLSVDGTIEGELVDADGDTKIQLEESSDDDTIRFDAGGNYVACIESTGVDIKGSYTLTLGGSLDANAQRLTNLGAPSSASDAATKTYVDTELSGLSQNSISQNNTNVTVTDSGTGQIVATIDGSAHTTFNSSGISLATGVFSGTATSSQYADLAEKYTSDQQYEPGTVVELGGEQEVTQTTRPWSCTIAGIVSTNPGFIMNKDLENSVEVALIGRVPCKVVGPVRKGEFLVSSRTPGHAEAHKDLHGPPAGSAIGKAIESKDTDGPGIIEVLVGRM